jgi:hypothetical protein
MTQLTLKDIYDVVNDRMDRMEDKIDDRFVTAENRIGTVEKLFNNMAGKVTIGVLVVGTFIGIITSYAVEFIRGIKS